MDFDHAQAGKKDQRQDSKRSTSLTKLEPHILAMVKQLGGMRIHETEKVKNRRITIKRIHILAINNYI